MVPGRQIVVYAQSSLLGWHSNGAHLAPEAFEAASTEIPAGRFPCAHFADGEQRFHAMVSSYFARW
jgi:hypothetical protein